LSLVVAIFALPFVVHWILLLFGII
jgi:hypothetical protein